ATFAHAQSASAPAISSTTRLGAAAGYWAVVGLRNRATDRCLDDSPAYGLRTTTCNSLSYQRFGLTLDYVDSELHDINTMQNQATGSCVDDSAAYGLRGYFCDQNHDANRAYQEFKLTPLYSGTWVLQNMATGSCIQDLVKLSGYFCNGTVFQEWVPIYY